MVKALSFKGDKKLKKRKRVDVDEKFGDAAPTNSKKNQVSISGEDNVAEDDSWISADVTEDIIGPIIIILPSEPCSCLACDTNGKVFTSSIENIIDNNPATAEPHEVRQVWVASRVAFTETFSLKGHHGKYLSCNKLGVLSCNAEAVSPLESFLIIPTADTPGTFQIQTLRETFLSVKQCATNASTKLDPSNEIRGDSQEITFSTTFRIRMQARFKPKYKASKQEKAREKISRKEIEEAIGRRPNDDEVKRLKKARREGNYHETLLLVKIKNKHDKYS